MHNNSRQYSIIIILVGVCSLYTYYYKNSIDYFREQEPREEAEKRTVVSNNTAQPKQTI